MKNKLHVYNHKDHLGNIRISYTRVDGVTKILEENNYYAFGLKHQNYNSPVKTLTRKVSDDTKSSIPAVENPYNYKYNGKELQEEFDLNLYDYGARNYDPALGRWINIDPLAEKYQSWSPYVYALDNPLRYIDPDGKEVKDPNLTKVREKARKSKTIRKLERQANINDKNFSSEVSIGKSTVTNPFNRKITIKENVSEDKAVIGYAHELSNRKNSEALKKNINDVRSGEITPNEYANNILNIEAEGVVNQIIVA